jgi:hypothetical protein
VSKTETQPPDFFAFVPSQIEAGRPYDSVLRDSPSASCPAESGMTASHSSVCTAKLFWKLPRRLTVERMCYFTKPKNDCSIRSVREGHRPMADEEVQGQESDPDGGRFDMRSGDDSRHGGRDRNA